MAFHTRQLQRNELSTIAVWMYEETWHVSTNILESCYDLDPKGWIAAETDDGQLIGSITGCILDDDTAFGGFFIVRKDWRKKGVGKVLFEKRLEYLQGRNFGIDAVENRVQYDKDHGFKQISFPIAAYMGKIDKTKLKLGNMDDGVLIKEFTSDHFQNLSVYDSKMHDISRVEFLKQWTDVKITKTYVALNAAGGIIGYGCIQPIEGGNFHIGPVFSDDKNVAQNILVKLMLSVPDGKQIGFDIPLENQLSTEIAKDHNMHLELKFYRMYTKHDIQFELDKIYAFTTMGIALV